MSAFTSSVLAEQLLLWMLVEDKETLQRLTEKQKKSLKRIKFLEGDYSDRTLVISMLLRTKQNFDKVSQRDFISKLAVFLDKPVFSYGGKGTIGLGWIAVNMFAPTVYLTWTPQITPQLEISDIVAFYKENLMSYSNKAHAYLNVGGFTLKVPVTERCKIVDKLPPVFNAFDNLLAYSPIIQTDGINIHLNPYKDPLLKSWLRVPLIIASIYQYAIGLEMPRVDVFKLSRIKLVGGGYFTKFVQRWWRLFGFDFITYVDTLKLAYTDDRKYKMYIDFSSTIIVGQQKIEPAKVYKYLIVPSLQVMRKWKDFIHVQVMQGAYIVFNDKFNSEQRRLTVVQNGFIENVSGPLVYVDVFPDFNRDREKIEDVALRIEKEYYGQIRTREGVISKVHDALPSDVYRNLLDGKCFNDVYTGKGRGDQNEFMYMFGGKEINVKNILHKVTIYAQDSISNSHNPAPQKVYKEFDDTGRQFIFTYPVGNFDYVNSIGSPSPFHSMFRTDHTLVHSSLAYAPLLLLANHIGLQYGYGLLYTTNILKFSNYVDIGYAGKVLGEAMRFFYDMDEYEYHDWRERVVAEVCRVNDIKDDFGSGFAGHAANELCGGASIAMVMRHVTNNSFPHKDYEYRRAIIFYLFICRFLKIAINDGDYAQYGLTERDVKAIITYSMSYVFHSKDLLLLLRPLEFR